MSAPIEGDEPEPGMEQKAEPEIERQPGQVEERGRADARQEASHRVEVPQRLQALRAGAALQRQGDDDVEDAGGQLGVEGRPDPGEQALAQEIEHALQPEQEDDENREADQGRDAAARQHPVIDLQHIDRAGQHQDVDDA